MAHDAFEASHVLTVPTKNPNTSVSMLAVPLARPTVSVATFRLRLMLSEDFGRFRCLSALPLWVLSMGQTGLINAFHLQNATPLTTAFQGDRVHGRKLKWSTPILG